MFQGFDDTTVDFLWGIRLNNERPWFESHKQDYLEHLYQPMKALGDELYDHVAPQLKGEPLMRKVSRIYRDARRLHGQGPYKDHLWFCIRTGDEDWTGRPTFYFEIAPDYYSYGMGFWAPKASLMEAYRKGIDEKPEELARLVRRFNRQEHFVLVGPEYARSRGEVSALLRPWYQKKSVNLQHELPPDERIFSPELARDMIEGFEALMPFYKYFDRLCAAQTER